MILSRSTGYTINIYVEMFHSEKQFDELEIFDGMQSLSFLFCNSWPHVRTHTDTHTDTATCI